MLAEKLATPMQAMCQ